MPRNNDTQSSERNPDHYRTDKFHLKFLFLSSVVMADPCKFSGNKDPMILNYPLI